MLGGPLFEGHGGFTAFATQKGKHRIKIIARYQQVDDQKGPLRLARMLRFAQEVICCVNQLPQLGNCRVFRSHS